MLVIASGHPEQIIRRILLVGKDVTPDSLGVGRQPVITTADVCGDALLPSFQDQGADLAGLGALLFQSPVQI
jgi:hypothetical protein